ncbi:hypothetical protein [Rhizobium redzepovicii]
MIAFNLVSSAAKTLVAAPAESKKADKILIPMLFITVILQSTWQQKQAQKRMGTTFNGAILQSQMMISRSSHKKI